MGLLPFSRQRGGEKPRAAAPEGRQAARLVHHSHGTARAEGFPHCPVHGVKLPTKGVCLRGALQKGSACCASCLHPARGKAFLGTGCSSLPEPRGWSDLKALVSELLSGKQGRSCAPTGLGPSLRVLHEAPCPTEVPRPPVMLPGTHGQNKSGR